MSISDGQAAMGLSTEISGQANILGGHSHSAEELGSASGSGTSFFNRGVMQYEHGDK